MEISNESFSSNIRETCKTIQGYIKNVCKKNADVRATHVETACEYIRRNVLDHDDDDLQLTKVQNICRKIYITTELMCDISVAFGISVDFEFRNMVLTLLNVEKLKKIASKILEKQKSELKREKYFRESVHKLMLTQLGDQEQILDPVSPQEHQPHAQSRQFYDSQALQQIQQPSQTELSLFMQEQSLMVRCETEEIGNFVDYIPNLPMSTINVPNEEQTYLKDSIREPSIREHLIGSHGVDNQCQDTVLSELLSNLNELESPMNTIEIAKKQTEQTGSSNNDSHLDQEQNGDFQDQPMDAVKELETPGEEEEEEDDDDDEEVVFRSLPELEHVKVKQKKKNHLIIDKEICIQNYSARALKLNKNVNIERVEVFEGPPEMVRALSVAHLMSNSGFLRCRSHDRRSSKLNALYKRHLTIQQKLHQPLVAHDERSTEGQKNDRNLEVEEMVNRAGMQVSRATSEHKKMRMDVTSKNTHLVDVSAVKWPSAVQSASGITVPQNSIPPTETAPHQIQTETDRTFRQSVRSLTDTLPFNIPPETTLQPASEVTSKTDGMPSLQANETETNIHGFAPPTTERIEQIIQQPADVDLLERMSRVQAESTSENCNQTAKTSTDSEGSWQRWHFQPGGQAPGNKWREFQFVTGKIENLWLICDAVGNDKEIKAKDLLEVEGDLNLANYLTLIRILDKLALQKRLSLNVKKGEIFVRPFESLCPTEDVDFKY